MTTQELMGYKIKELRTQKKISQTALAKKIGYKDKTAIAKIEAGKVDLPQSKILAFASALDTTPAYLLSDSIDINHIDNNPSTIAAHFDGEEYTESELEEIKAFAKFVKSKRT